MSEGNGKKTPLHYTPAEFQQLQEDLSKPDNTVDLKEAVNRLIHTLRAVSAIMKKKDEQTALMAQCLAALTCILAAQGPIHVQRREGQSVIIIPMLAIKHLNPQGDLNVVEQTRCVTVSWKEPKKLIQLSRELPQG